MISVITNKPTIIGYYRFSISSKGIVIGTESCMHVEKNEISYYIPAEFICNTLIVIVYRLASC